MVLSILATAGLTFATLFYYGEEPYMSSAILVMVVGVNLVACAKQVAKARRQISDEGRPMLRRVK